MVIRIAIDTTAPLVGTAAAERREPVHFVGWLELLRAISGLVEDGGCGDRQVHLVEAVGAAAAQATDGQEWCEWLLRGDAQ